MAKEPMKLVANNKKAYHDYFIELLSYDRKHNYAHNNIWEFSYV